MNRSIERAENMARLLDTGLHMASTRAMGSGDEWASILMSAGAEKAFSERHDEHTLENVADFLLRDRTNPSSVLSSIELARTNGRMVRTALTRDTWEALNEAWMVLGDLMKKPVDQRDLPRVLNAVKRETALVRGTAHGTMLRSDKFSFLRLGTYLERADNTARILDVKYYVLLPSVKWVGSSLDNRQWESILRSVSAHRAYRWSYDSPYNPTDISDFLILNSRMPRSLSHCYKMIDECLCELDAAYDNRHDCHNKADSIRAKLSVSSIDDVFEEGLHEFLVTFIRDNYQLSQDISEAYRFY